MKNLILATIFSLFALSLAQKRVVCYFPSYKYTDPDPTICTHLIYAFFNVGSDGDVVSFLPNGYSITTFVAFRSKNPSLKVMFAIGGANAGVNNFKNVAASASITNTFANKIVEHINTYGFDGVDIDWEYPDSTDNFLGMLTAVRNALPSGKLLTFAAYPASSKAESIYPSISEIAAKVDFINLMTYDFHGSWESQTYSSAPLYAGTLDTTPLWKSLNVDASVGFWVSKGVPKDKLVVGVPLYGVSWTLTTARNDLGAPAIGDTTVEYNQICLNIKNNGWTNVYYSQQAISYAYKGNKWVSFDDLTSLNAKVSYIKSNNLGGVMFWEMTQDDYSGACGNGKFPIIANAYNLLVKNGVLAPNVTAGTTTQLPTTTQQTTTTQAPTPQPGSFTCSQSSGIFKNPNSCTSYIQCDNFNAYIMQCPTGLNFNGLTKVCDYPQNAPCIVNSVTTKASTAAPVTQTHTTTKTVTLTSTASTTKAAQTTTKAASSSTNPCANKIGIVANPANCNTFYNCGSNGVGTLMSCQTGLGFNPTFLGCDFKSNIPGCV